MLVLSITWFWMGINTLIWGGALCGLLGRITGYRVRSVWAKAIAGIAGLTIYAELFSLFEGVGSEANAGLVVIDALFIMIAWRDIREITVFFLKSELRKKIRAVAIPVAVLIILYPAIRAMPAHYDTYLYHAQAIRWIEDYGIVPGLGNLHSRFAYNSSFFCFQALFSMKFLFGRSVHAANAFCMWLLISYALITQSVWKRDSKLKCSDIIKLGMIYVLLRGDNYWNCSSPSTDVLAQGLIMFIFAEWAVLCEKKERQPAPYLYLGILGAFSASLKLTAAVVIVLMLKPVIMLIKEKKYDLLAKYIIIGVIVIAPYLIRNVIISGYLLYPYPGIDLFSFDWKMNRTMAGVEKAEIQAWARGVNDWKRFGLSLGEWLPVWWAKKIAPYPIIEALLVSHLFLCPAGIIMGLRDIKKNRYEISAVDFLFLLLCAAINLMFLLISAPDPRFGAAFMILIPIMVVSRGLFAVPEKTLVVIGRLAVVSTAVLFVFSSLRGNEKHDFAYALGYQYYDRYKEGEASLFDDSNITVYTPVNGDQISYEYFPSTPYKRIIDLIELRTEDLSGGFKLKDEYKDSYITTSGKALERDPFL